MAAAGDATLGPQTLDVDEAEALALMVFGRNPES